MHYIRIGMFSVKTPQGAPLRIITSSVAIKPQWLTLDHWECPLNNSLKDSGGVKKTSLIAIKQRWLTLDYWACPLNNIPNDSGEVKITIG